MKFFLTILLAIGSAAAMAQATSDTTKVLDEVIVKAYRSDRPLKDVPVTVNVVDGRELSRFSPAAIVSAVNTVPGVRMEERSPGSYRFSIRGSLLRSPFGIRNVKFYWKGLPFTDGGGNTYLNLLDFGTVGQMEIIKGPGASLYGAGTGGVVLLDAPKHGSNSVTGSILAGSYGLFRYAGQTSVDLGKSDLTVAYSNQKSDGYRKQTALTRDNVRLAWTMPINNKSEVSLTYLGSNLAYETPGGLTLAQFEDDPSQARPSTQTAPGAEAQHARINNKTHFFGGSYQNDWNENWSTTVGLYGSLTKFVNPAILNYEQRKENNWGGRTETQYTFGDDTQKGKFTFGAEYQSFYSPLDVYENNAGERGNVRTQDKLTSKSFFTFAQVELELPYSFLMTAGGSANVLKYKMERTYPDQTSQDRNFDPGFFPRLAIIKKFTEQFSIYSSISQGFSAPTIAEVRPSTGNFNNDLNPEKGRSIEAGIRTEFFSRQLKFNVVAYDFRLKQTIVVQSAVNGADYFINAGATSQKGIESTLAWTPSWSKLDLFRMWVSYTYNDYHFLDYVANGNDLSGNRLTGVPPVVVVSGLDISKKGWYANVTFNYSDHIPVNDASTVFAKEYMLLGARVGKKLNMKQLSLDVFIGGDNLLDETYSLGNDLNAAGGRYFNAAPRRNYYAGISIPFKGEKAK